SDAYQVMIKGGNYQVLKRWIPNLVCEDDCWYGELNGEPQEFIASLRLMDAQLISMDLGCISLEEFFIQKLKEHGIDSSK
ncbi:MAG: multidrug ABC transporter ATP-binding protein, partial [Moorea sp. SIO2B7]|nr:multidrug ABC transporter ATP-binding protein [Moorena sp. SIO2B7]